MTSKDENLTPAMVLKEMEREYVDRIRRIKNMLKRVEQLQRLAALFSEEGIGGHYFRISIEDLQDRIDHKVDELLLHEKQFKDYAKQHDNGSDLNPDDVQRVLSADPFRSIFVHFYELFKDSRNYK